MQSDNPTAAILVIGDEILSGRTREGNAHHLSQVLNSIGIDLCEIRIVADEEAQIVAAIRALDKSLGGAWDMLFTSGGIGPTHDDITADAVAKAFNTGISIHADARRILEDRWGRQGVEITENRLRMARIPHGATLIDNPVSAAPGFSIGNTHVMAGVPEVFRAMVDSLRPGLATGRPTVSEALEVLRPESDVANPLRQVAEEYPDLSLGCYPFKRGDRYGTSLVIRGLDQKRVTDAMTKLRERLAL